MRRMSDQEISNNEDSEKISNFFEEMKKAVPFGQLIFCTTTGWCSGFILMRFQRPIGVLVASGLISLQLAYEFEIIKINWSKLNDQLDNISDKIEETIEDEPSTSIKVERFVDKTLEKAEKKLMKGGKKAKKLFDKATGKKKVQMKKLETLAICFMTGLCLGMISGAIVKK